MQCLDFQIAAQGRRDSILKEQFHYYMVAKTNVVIKSVFTDIFI